jgi:hypothetical protein
MTYQEQKTQILKGLTSNLPLLLTKGKEHKTIIVKMLISATPVGFAHPPIIPKTPGLLVKSHSP